MSPTKSNPVPKNKKPLRADIPSYPTRIAEDFLVNAVSFPMQGRDIENIEKPQGPGLWRFFGSRVSLGIKLPVIVIVLLMLAFIISTFLSVGITQTALIDTLQSELSSQSASKAELIRANLIWSRSVAIDLAAVAEVSNYDEETILKIINNTLARNSQIFGSTIAYEPYQFQPDLYYWSPYYSRTANNELQFTQLGNPDYDYFSLDWYTQPKAKREPVLSSPYFDFGGGDIWMVTWGAPFFDKTSGALKGVATADIAFSQTQEIVNKITVGKDGYAFLIDRQGTILGVGKNAGGYYETMADSMTTSSFSVFARNWKELIAEMMGEKTGFMDVVDPQGKPLFVAYTPVGMNTGWSLALAYPQAELLQTPSQLRNTLIIYSSIVVLIFGVILYLFTRSITKPIQSLTTYANQFTIDQLASSKGKLIDPIKIKTQDELEDLAIAFNIMSSNLTNTFESLEEKVADRTRESERRSLELETIAEVARDITIIRDLNTLLNVAANLICERFKYYHVGIFLVGDNGEFAYLRAASSDAAQQMLDQNYKLRVGQQGMVGNVIRTGQARIAQDVDQDSAHFQNPFLPETRSEITLPLRSRSLTIGALDIQSDIQSAFKERDISVLQLLADQLAAAIENAQLAQQVEGTFLELSSTYRLQTQNVWSATINKREHSAYEYDGIRVQAVPQDLPDNLLQQLETGKPIIIKANNIATDIKETLLIPLMVRNQVIGVIGMEQEDPNHIWTEEEMAIAEAAANRAGLTLENARLLEESQRRAVKERTIFEATTRIGSALNIENILQTTAEELERVLSGSEVILQFQSENDPKPEN